MKIVQPMSILDANLLSSNVTETDYPVYSASTVYKTGDRVIVIAANSHKVYESLTGASSTITLTIASPCLVSWAGHGLTAGTPVTFTTTGTLPTGMLTGVVYYVSATGLTANSFQFSTTLGGSSVNTSGTQTGVHTATASLNYNQPVTNTTYWLDAGSTNRWKMFDQSVQSQTTNANTIQVSLSTTSVFNTIAFLNIDAASVRVKITHAVDGVLYDQTVSLTSYYGVYDWYTYFFSPINKQIDLVFQDLPKYGVVTVDITITKTGATAACGVCLLGYANDISSTGKGVEAGAKVSIDDYSVKDIDEFGNYTIVQRTFNKRADFTVVIESSTVDYVVNLLTQYRATPILYIGSSKYNSTIVYGFYKNFEVDIAYDTISYCTIQLEGLT